VTLACPLTKYSSSTDKKVAVDGDLKDEA